MISSTGDIPWIYYNTSPQYGRCGASYPESGRQAGNQASGSPANAGGKVRYACQQIEPFAFSWVVFQVVKGYI